MTRCGITELNKEGNFAGETSLKFLSKLTFLFRIKFCLFNVTNIESLFNKQTKQLGKFP